MTYTEQKGVQIQLDVTNYVDGMNQWIAETEGRSVEAGRALRRARGIPSGA